MSRFIMQPRARDTLRSVYPLIREAMPSVSRTAWLTFARPPSGRHATQTGVIAARRTGRAFPCGLFCERAETHRANGRLLSAEHFVAVDLLDPPAVLAALIAESERLGHRLGCDAVRGVGGAGLVASARSAAGRAGLPLRLTSGRCEKCRRMIQPHSLIVAGPTASGKSALALDLARRLGGTIINADSMQVYRELRILTARPSVAEEARIPHRLYGIRSAADPGSAAWWRGEALAAMADAVAGGRLPILTGGSGLYFAALTDGLSDLPATTPEARAEARTLLKEHGAPALHGRLAAVDPATAATLNPKDSQRVARAWEVWHSTGIGLTAWQAQRGRPAPYRFTAILLDPPRAQLRAAIAARLQSMLAQGALDEVRALLGLHLDPALPAMRAHGVPTLAAYLHGEISLPEATRRVELVTGQYTKRQATWFRHHALARPDRTRTIASRYSGPEQFMERPTDQIITFIQRPG